MTLKLFLCFQNVHTKETIIGFSSQSLLVLNNVNDGQQCWCVETEVADSSIFRWHSAEIHHLNIGHFLFITQKCSMILPELYSYQIRKTTKTLHMTLKVSRESNENSWHFRLSCTIGLTQILTDWCFSLYFFCAVLCIIGMILILFALFSFVLYICMCIVLFVLVLCQWCV